MKIINNQLVKSGMILSIAAVIAFSLLVFSKPNACPALAQVTGEIPFGGLHVSTIDCTCTGNTLLYIYDYKTKTVLPLIYQAGASTLYRNYNIFGLYLLGTYSPGSGTCEIEAGEDCEQISSDGQLGNRPGTGTSLQ